MVRENDREIRRIRALLLCLVVGEVIAVVVPRLYNPWHLPINYLPQLLIGFVVLALIFTMHLASQRKLLVEVTTALMSANSYVNRLEQSSFIDPPTQLFNRRYLDQLFFQQLKWLKRSCKPATLLLLEVLPDGDRATADEIVVEAAFVLRSNFRGSDYVVRYSANQFLVMLPDTIEQEAQIALSRLIDKVDHWNLANDKWEMALRLELRTVAPDGNLWETVCEMEETMQDKSAPGVRMHNPLKPSAPEICSQEHPAQIDSAS